MGSSAVGDEGDVFDAKLGEERDDGFLEDEEAGGEGDGRRATETGSEWLISFVVELIERTNRSIESILMPSFCAKCSY